MSEQRRDSQNSKTSLFFRSLFPGHNRENRPIHVDGLAFVAEEVKSKKIMVVDDDAVTLKTLSVKLNNIGYQVVTATDGAEAIRGMREDKPDLIILDIHFPPDVPHGGGVPWDGFILMKWLSAMERGQKIPVIFITSSSAGLREKALASGALGLFDKPIDHVRLLSVIQKAFAGKAAADPNFQI